jgi:pimeloyl-ACP methyl ester carboxylesterase
MDEVAGRGSGRPRLVLAHGIGGVRDVRQERRSWVTALATSGARPTDVVFVGYSGLFRAEEARGLVDEYDVDLVLALVQELVDELTDGLAEEPFDPLSARVLADVWAQLAGVEEQGPGEVVRTIGNVLTTLLQLPGLRQAGQWASGRALLGHLAQVARYLRRAERDGDGSLDVRIRAQMLAALAGGPSVVVAHSLGTIVAFEALHEHTGDVPLLVTLGSPLAMSTVWHRLQPRPPATPECVGRWLNFWDRDDIVVARSQLANRILSNSRGVGPSTSQVRSTGLWTHTATKYLVRPEVAAPVLEALRCAG